MCSAISQFSTSFVAEAHYEFLLPIQGVNKILLLPMLSRRMSRLAAQFAIASPRTSVRELHIVDLSLKSSRMRVSRGRSKGEIVAEVV